MNRFIEDIERIKAEVEQQEKDRVRILVFHDIQDLHSAIRAMPAPKDPPYGFVSPQPFLGVAMVVEPELAKEKGKILASSDQDFASALIKDLREKPGRIWKE